VRAVEPIRLRIARLQLGQVQLSRYRNATPVGKEYQPIRNKRGRRKYLEENVAAESVQLDPAQVKVLDDALAPAKVSGKGYADWIMATIDR